MTRVFFYHNAGDRVAVTAALIGKAYQQGKPSLIYAPDQAAASALDRLLWSHPPTGFIPHVRDTSPLANETPILISATLETPRQQERVFNLSEAIPPGVDRFTSVIEIIGQEDAERASGRQRAKYYREMGLEVRFIDMAEKQG